MPEVLDISTKCNDCRSVYITLGVLVALAFVLMIVVFVLVRRRQQRLQILPYIQEQLPPPARTDTVYTNQPDYRIQVVDNFLTAEECAQLRAIAEPHLFDSAVYSSDKDVMDPNTRISRQCWLQTNVSVVRAIRERMRTLIPNLSASAHLEDVQIVQYKPGGFFKPHYDACVGSRDFCQRMDHPHGPRYITVLIYLNENLTGGETVFPKINQKVTPKTGRVVVFYNVDRNQHIITEAMHGGEPVLTGEKWIANQWIRIW